MTGAADRLDPTLGSVLVLAGGLSHEREVSLRSGRRVLEALRSSDVDAELGDVDRALVRRLKTERPDVVFPLLHGVIGEDGALREVLELLEIPYVGSTAAACRLAFDKPTAKAAVATAGVATPPAVALPKDLFRDLGAGAALDLIASRLGFPLMVKPARGGSALGCSLARDATDLPAAMVTCFSYGDTALLERYIDGTEIAVAVVDAGNGPQALPAVEIVPDSGSYDYHARYSAGTTRFFTPARVGPDLTARLADLALTVHRTLGLRDLSRTDLVVDPSGTPWFLEVNVAPGLTETSLLPQAAAAAGLQLGALYRDLVGAALSRGTNYPGR